MPARPPATTGQKIAAGVILAVAAFWLIALAVSWNHEPDDAVVCNDGARYPSASAVMACLDNASR